MHLCPRCQSERTYRSKQRGLIGRGPLTLLSLRPFRCRDCQRRFFRTVATRRFGASRPNPFVEQIKRWRARIGPRLATSPENHCSVPPFVDRHTQAKNDPDQYISRLCVGGREAFRKLFAHDRQLSTPNYVKVGALGYRLTFVKSICMRRKTGARGGSRTR
jgi:hypothetical protein